MPNLETLPRSAEPGEAVWPEAQGWGHLQGDVLAVTPAMHFN